MNSLPSTYDPLTNVWTDHPSASLTTPLYPQLFVLSDGRIVDVGPDTTTRVLDPATWTWSVVGTSPFDGHSAVMYRPNKIMKSGTWADPDFRSGLAFNANGRTAVIDMSAPTPAWRETSPMANARSYHNLTLLPDGTVLASGGGTRSDGVDLANAVKPAEIWNPDTETWTTVASLTNGRLYHSTALLLPDGRVLMAGGGQLPGSGAVNQRNAEIYSPPYLFKGARPIITSAPGTMAYGTSFDVTTPNAAQIAKVSLIRSPSVTHALDMNQRFQFLNFTASAGKVTVQAPANANLAPPGDYMLFLVDTNGVPSTAAFVRAEAPAGHHCADGRHHGSDCRRQPLEHGLRHGRRERQRPRRGRAVQARRRQPRHRGHDGAVRDHLGHAHRVERVALADGRGPRLDRQHDDLNGGRRDGHQRADGARGRVQLR